MGHWGQGKMGTHQQKKLDDDALHEFRDRFALPLSDDDVAQLRFYKPGRRRAGDEVPARAPRGARRLPAGAHRRRRRALAVPPLTPSRARSRARATASSRRRWSSCSCSRSSCATPSVGKRIVPIVADEARTFGMQSLFRQVGIYSSVGPALRARGPRRAALLQGGEGRPDPRGGHHRGRRAVAPGSRRRRATARTACRCCRSTSSTRCSASSASATSSGPRPTRARAASCSAPPPAARRSPGEGLQHQDGSSHLVASTIPNCRAYDPCFGYELAADRAGRRAADAGSAGGRLLLRHRDERELRAPGDAGRRGGGDPARDVSPAAARRRGRCSSSAAARSCARSLAAADMLEREHGIAANVWSVTSWTELRWDGMECERARRLGAIIPADAGIQSGARGDDASSERVRGSSAASRHNRPDRRRERLRARGCRPRASLCARRPRLHRARHRRLRSQRHARRAARVLRSGSGGDRAGGARGARARSRSRETGRAGALAPETHPR